MREKYGLKCEDAVRTTQAVIIATCESEECVIRHWILTKFFFSSSLKSLARVKTKEKISNKGKS